MAAHLPPGGRFVNYDPQTYSSYPGSPQGVPDLNIMPGAAVGLRVRLHRERELRVDDAHPRAGRPRHRAAVSGTLGRLDLREVVTVPEYFLVPLQATPTILDDVTQISEGSGQTPSFPGDSARLQRDGLPLLSGPAGPSAHGTDGLLVLRGVARSRRAPPWCWRTRQPGRRRPLRDAGRRRATRWGAPVPVPAGASTGDRRASHPAVRRPVGPGAVGPLPSQRAVIAVAGRPYELDGSLSSAVIPGPWHLAGLSRATRSSRCASRPTDPP